MSDITDALEKHLRDWLHITPEEMGGRTMTDMISDHERYNNNINELADKLLGTPRTELEGAGRHHDGLVEEWHTYVANGNGQSRLSRLQLAGMGGFVSVIVYAKDLVEFVR